MSTRTAPTVARSPTRCPFCHDQVDLETRWVACRACLARHHRECWGEAGACAGCGVATCLAEDTPWERDEDLTRAALLERLESPRPVSPGPRLFDYVLALGSFGLAPALLAESRLIAHAREGLAGQAEVRADAKPRDRETRAPGHLGRTLAGAQVRRSRTGFAFALCATLAGIGAGISGATHSDVLGNALLLLGVLAWVVTLLAQLVGHHRAVRQHEAAQLASVIRGQALDGTSTYRLVTRHEESWKRTGGGLLRGAGVALLLGALCFPLAWLPLPLWVARAFQVPLEEHLRRERLGALRG